VLAGNVTCGDAVFIAIGAVIGPNLRIGSRSVVAAGSTVLEDVGDEARVFGTPARPKRG
jgi:acetyltransferase-like isoleucine patch superfamily enzyme